MPDQADRLRQLVRLARAHQPPPEPAAAPPRPWAWLAKAAHAWKTQAPRRRRESRDAVQA